MTTSTPEPGDAEVIARVKAGAVNDFELLITRHRAQVFAIVAGHVPAASVAETAHDVFVRAFLSLANYRTERPFNHWLARLAMRTCYDFWRRRKRTPETPLNDLTDEHQQWLDRAAYGASQAALAADVSRRDAAEVLEWALRRLDAGERLVLTMLHQEGHSVSEIAKRLGWTATRVKVTAFRARNKIRGVVREAMQKKGRRT